MIFAFYSQLSFMAIENKRKLDFISTFNFNCFQETPFLHVGARPCLVLCSFCRENWLCNLLSLMAHGSVAQLLLFWGYFFFFSRKYVIYLQMLLYCLLAPVASERRSAELLICVLLCVMCLFGRHQDFILLFQLFGGDVSVCALSSLFTLFEILWGSWSVVWYLSLFSETWHSFLLSPSLRLGIAAPVRPRSWTLSFFLECFSVCNFCRPVFLTPILPLALFKSTNKPAEDSSSVWGFCYLFYYCSCFHLTFP